MRYLHLHLVVACTLSVAATSAGAQAANCDSIRAGIDAKIRASGASGYTLAVVAADAKVDGKVVGSCERGTKKIVYATGAPASAPRAVAPTDAPILTECKDGTVTRGGDCKQ